MLELACVLSLALIVVVVLLAPGTTPLERLERLIRAWRGGDRRHGPSR